MPEAPNAIGMDSWQRGERLLYRRLRIAYKEAVERELREGSRDQARYPLLSSGALVLDRPARVRQEIWDVLTCTQKFRKGVLVPLFHSVRIGEGFSLEDLVHLVYEEGGNGLTSEEGEVLCAVLRDTSYNHKNPTLSRVTKHVVRRMRAGRPLEIEVSQCLRKRSWVYERSFSAFLRERAGGDEGGPSPMNGEFFDGIYDGKWEKLRAFLERIPYPIHVSLRIGDIDCWTLYSCEKWATPEDQQRLRVEILGLLQQIQARADEYFGAGKIQAEKWSDHYTVEEFSQELAHAHHSSLFDDDKLYRQCQHPYHYEWGYERMARERGCDGVLLREFIVNDIRKTAAQYRVEARVNLRQDHLKMWAETYGAPLTPLQLSGYDGGAIPPTLLL